MHIDELRRQLAAFGQPARGRRYPQPLRDSLCGWLQSQRALGRRWSELAADTGLHVATLYRLAGSPASSQAAHPVRLVPVLTTEPAREPPSGRHLRLMLPSGLVVEGLCLDSVVALVQRLA
jgi:hypothetical protein